MGEIDKLSSNDSIVFFENGQHLNASDLNRNFNILAKRHLELQKKHDELFRLYQEITDKPHCCKSE